MTPERFPFSLHAGVPVVCVAGLKSVMRLRVYNHTEESVSDLTIRVICSGVKDPVVWRMEQPVPPGCTVTSELLSFTPVRAGTPSLKYEATFEFKGEARKSFGAGQHESIDRLTIINGTDASRSTVAVLSDLRKKVPNPPGTADELSAWLFQQLPDEMYPVGLTYMGRTMRPGIPQQAKQEGTGKRPNGPAGGIIDRALPAHKVPIQKAAPPAPVESPPVSPAPRTPPPKPPKPRPPQKPPVSAVDPTIEDSNPSNEPFEASIHTVDDEGAPPPIEVPGASEAEAIVAEPQAKAPQVLRPPSPPPEKRHTNPVDRPPTPPYIPPPPRRPATDQKSPVLAKRSRRVPIMLGLVTLAVAGIIGVTLHEQHAEQGASASPVSPAAARKDEKPSAPPKSANQQKQPERIENPPIIPPKDAQSLVRQWEVARTEFLGAVKRLYEDLAKGDIEVAKTQLKRITEMRGDARFQAQISDLASSDPQTKEQSIAEAIAQAEEIRAKKAADDTRKQTEVSLLRDSEKAYKHGQITLLTEKLADLEPLRAVLDSTQSDLLTTLKSGAALAFEARTEIASTQLKIDFDSMFSDIKKLEESEVIAAWLRWGLLIRKYLHDDDYVSALQTYRTMTRPDGTSRKVIAPPEDSWSPLITEMEKLLTLSVGRDLISAKSLPLSADSSAWIAPSGTDASQLKDPVKAFHQSLSTNQNTAKLNFRDKPWWNALDAEIGSSTWGAATLNAVLAAQHALELPITGCLSDELLHKLGISKEPHESSAAMSNPSLAGDLPFATAVPGKAGFVYSPFTTTQTAIDVRDMPPGGKARCPYTQKIFRVPLSDH